MSAIRWPFGHLFFRLNLVHVCRFGIIACIELTLRRSLKKPSGTGLLCLELSGMHEHVRQGLKVYAFRQAFSSCSVMNRKKAEPRFQTGL